MHVYSCYCVIVMLCPSSPDSEVWQVHESISILCAVKQLQMLSNYIRQICTGLAGANVSCKIVIMQFLGSPVMHTVTP